MKDELTIEEKKIIFNAVRHWQIHKTALDGKEYNLCNQILNRWFDDVYTQQKEQTT